MRSSGMFGTRSTSDGLRPVWSAYRLLRLSICSIFSVVKSRQKGGGSGNIAETWDGSTGGSAIVAAAN